LRSIIFHITLLLATLPCFAQQPAYRHITEDDGLPDNEIYHLYQDRRGIMWISTNGGLCRYNGQTFQQYSHPQLKAKSTGCIKEDVYGRIWVANFSGQIFYVNNDSLVIVQLPGITDIKSPFTISPQNELVVGSEKEGILIYKPLHKTENEKPEYVLDTILPQLSNNPCYTSDGTLWAAITNDLYTNLGIAGAYKNRKMQYYKYAVADNGFARTDGVVFEWNKEVYYFGRRRSALFRKTGQYFVQAHQLNMPGLISTEPLQDGSLALNTNNGLYLSKPDKQSISIAGKLFTGLTIGALCQDRLGNLWVGSLTDGIYFVPKEGLSRLTSPRPDIDYNNITTICAGPDNTLLLGFLNGELGMLSKDNHYQTLQPANKLSNKIQSLFYSPRLQVLNWHTEDIYQSHFAKASAGLQPVRGVGYATKDMAYIHPWNAVLMANPTDIQVMSLDKVPIGAKVPAGWTATYDTFTYFEKNTMPWPQQSLILGKERGRAVYYDETTQTLWGADKKGITLYRETGASHILLNNKAIYATNFCYHKGIVWVGTFSQGLIMIENEKPVKQYTLQDGLVSNTIYKIIGSSGHLWISTDKGLQYFDIAQQTYTLIDKTLGLPSYKINAMALVNGHLFISTPKGLLTIPDSITHEKNGALQVYLQGVYCNNAVADTLQHIYATNDNYFIFKIETPVYNNRTMLRYRYWLKGAEKHYSVATLNEAVFEYKSLPPGTYEFELQLTDVKGSSIGHPIRYAFTIKPPFYATVWFIGLCCLLLITLVYSLVRRRIKQIQKKEQYKLQLVQLESELKQSQLSGIKAQMNPHFMFNALNSIQEFILLNDKKQANLYMGKFADLMRMTLDMSNKKEVVLEDEITMLELYLELEALRFEEKFIYHIHIDNNVDKAHIYLPAMLIQPHIENAVKHGLLHKTGEKKLEVHFRMQDANTLNCKVADNGIGRKRSSEINARQRKKHTSFATGATQRRLELLNHGKQQPIGVNYNDLIDAHGNAIGTVVSIIIPV